MERGGTTVKTTSNWEQSVWWLYSLHSYIQKEHIPKTDRKYTQKEEIEGVLNDIPKVGLETAQQIYAVYELLYKPFNTTDVLVQNPQTLNSLDVNPLMLKAFDRVLTKVKSVLREKRLSKNVLIGQLKARITKNEALLNAFLSVLIEEGYLQKEQKGKYVYYSVRHKNAQKARNNVDKIEASKTNNVSKEDEVNSCDEEEDQKWLKETEEDWKTIENE